MMEKDIMKQETVNNNKITKNIVKLGKEPTRTHKSSRFPLGQHTKRSGLK